MRIKNEVWERKVFFFSFLGYISPITKWLCLVLKYLNVTHGPKGHPDFYVKKREKILLINKQKYVALQS